MRSKLSTIKDIKKKYYGLRSSYRAIKRKLTAPSGSGLDAKEKSSWPLFDSLAFLEFNNSFQLESGSESFIEEVENSAKQKTQDLESTGLKEEGLDTTTSMIVARKTL